MAVLLIGIIGTILLNRGSDTDTDNNGNTGTGENGENQAVEADFEYEHLGLQGVGHVANPPNSNVPISVYVSVDSEVSDEQLDAFFDHAVAPLLGEFEPNPLRSTYVAKIYVYNSYEGLGVDYSDMQPPVAGPADTEKMAAAKSRVEAALRKTYSYEIPPLPERDELLTSFGNGYYRIGEDIAPGTYVMTTVSLGHLSPVQDASALFETREVELAPGISYKVVPPTDEDDNEVVIDIADGDHTSLSVCRLTYATADDDNAGWLNDDSQFQALPGSTVTVTIGESIASFSPHLEGCGTWQLQPAEDGADN
ncbi:hypothetical protein F4X86_02535 [Candidatus Saccharibacteria bacterium]|nr:hypothetical protein [Candidatus Saccharibacteria bacterium]